MIRYFVKLTPARMLSRPLKVNVKPLSIRHIPIDKEGELNEVYLTRYMPNNSDKVVQLSASGLRNELFG